MPDSIFRLLAMCARAECNAEQLRTIAQTASTTTWEHVPLYAEAHSITPLVYRHLIASGAQVPSATKRELHALTIRHRSASQVRTQVLQNILASFQSVGIHVLVLKGAALAYLLYTEPGLRPMRDIDLLVSRQDAIRAQQLLGKLGFDAPLPASGQTIAHRHLSTATRIVEGFTISVEIHHTLFEPGASPMTLDIEQISPLSFLIGDQTASTLSYEEMLWYLCQHLVESTNIFSSVGLIWIADIVSYAERFIDQIDWERTARQYPLVLNTLSLLHFLTPLSDDLIARACVNIGREPQGLWDNFRKLPRTTPDEKLTLGYRRILSEVLAPSDWWLRLYYGLGSAQPLRWSHRVQHLAYLMRRFNHVTRRRKKI